MAHDPVETKCEMEKCHQRQMFARNTFIQLLSDGSKARADSKSMQSSSPGAVIRRSVSFQTMCKV